MKTLKGTTYSNPRLKKKIKLSSYPGKNKNTFQVISKLFSNKLMSFFFSPQWNKNLTKSFLYTFGLQVRFLFLSVVGYYF